MSVLLAGVLLSGTAMAAPSVFINELHYDNDGGDVNEALEIAGPVGTDLSGWSVVLYNGSTGAAYDSMALSGGIPASCGSSANGVVTLSPASIQNGGPDGLALVDASGAVVQFLSYEGSFTAGSGPAAGQDSHDIGASESGGTAANASLQLTGSGTSYADFSWSGPQASSFGACNPGQTFPLSAPLVFFNELHYDNDGGDVNEALEIAGPVGTDLSGWSVVLYNGSTGAAYDSMALSGGIPASCGSSANGVVTLSPTSIQNGGPDGLALVDASGAVVQFLSYEGSFTAGSGPAAGQASHDIGASESGGTAANASLQLTGSGTSYADFSWGGPQASSFGGCNAGQTFDQAGDAQPTVTSTAPTGNSTMGAGGSVVVNFSEPVTLAGNWYQLTCDSSGIHAASVSGGPASYTLDPAVDFQSLENCIFTIWATAVHDQDGSVDAMAANAVVHFSIAGSGGNYYAGVDTSSQTALENSLHAIIKQATAFPYTGSGTDTWDIMAVADQDPNNPGNVLAIYANESAPSISGGMGWYNREHTWPNSLGFPERSINGHPNPPYTDMHMLRASDVDYNSARGNKPYGDCPPSACTIWVTFANNGFGGNPAPVDDNWVDGPDGNQGTFEVWGHRKGDVARSILYMAVRYDGGVGQYGIQLPDLRLTNNRNLIERTDAQNPAEDPDGIAYMGLLDVLLEWHQQDPPDNQERLRNDVVYSYQGNRNPFVDHPEWALCVFKGSNCPGAALP